MTTWQFSWVSSLCGEGHLTECHKLICMRLQCLWGNDRSWLLIVFKMWSIDLLVFNIANGLSVPRIFLHYLCWKLLQNCPNTSEFFILVFLKIVWSPSVSITSALMSFYNSNLKYFLINKSLKGVEKWCWRQYVQKRKFDPHHPPSDLSLLRLEHHRDGSGYVKHSEIMCPFYKLTLRGSVAIGFISFFAFPFLGSSAEPQAETLAERLQEVTRERRITTRVVTMWWLVITLSLGSTREKVGFAFHSR